MIFEAVYSIIQIWVILIWFENLEIPKIQPIYITLKLVYEKQKDYTV